MPDQPDQPDQPHAAGRSEPPDAPDATQEQVRRLLREVRHDGPVPLEVVERLEHALAVEAEAAAAGRPGSSPVVPLAHRRRRRAVGLLVAAVAIVVIGVGVGQVLRPAVDDAASSAGAIDGRVDAGQASRSGAPDRGTDTDDGADSDGGGVSDVPAPSAEPGEPGEPGARQDGPGVLPEAVAPDVGTERALLLLGDPPAVSSLRFARDVRTVRRDVAALPASPAAPATPDFACEDAAWGPGRTVATLLDGTPAVLVLRPVVGETQVVDLLQCGSGDLLRSVTLPAR